MYGLENESTQETQSMVDCMAMIFKRDYKNEVLSKKNSVVHGDGDGAKKKIMRDSTHYVHICSVLLRSICYYPVVEHN